MNNDNKYINALNVIIQDIKKNIGHAIVNNLFQAFSADGPYPNVFSFQDNKITSIEQGTDESLKIFVWQLLTGLSDEEEQKVITLIKKNILSFRHQVRAAFFGKFQQYIPRRYRPNKKRSAD